MIELESISKWDGRLSSDGSGCCWIEHAEKVQSGLSQRWVRLHGIMSNCTQKVPVEGEVGIEPRPFSIRQDSESDKQGASMCSYVFHGPFRKKGQGLLVLVK